MAVIRFSKAQHRLSVLIVALCIMPTVRTQVSVTSCLPANMAQPSNQPAQPNLPDSFRVKVEVTVEGRESTEQAEEIVSGNGNRAVLTTLSNGVQTSVFFLYDTQEIIYLTGSNCSVHNMSSDPDRFLFFGQTMIDGRGHIPNGASALYFGSQIAKEYKGTAVIRGIQCDWWHSCISWPSFNMTFTIDHYFSVKSWKTPSTFSQAPIRYDVNGTQRMSNGTVRPFYRTYDFFEFMQDADSDPSVFQTPEGVVCPGRISTRSMPQLTSQYFHFREEIVDVAGGVLAQADVWYDLDSKLVRVDYRSPSKEPPLFTTDPVSIVHDFNYGVSYARDLVSGECQTMALYQGSFDARVNTPAFLINGSYVMHMKTQMSFFFLDSNFTYSGQRRARDALCDVFISHRHDMDFYNNGSAIEAKVEVYFLADSWADVPDDGYQGYSTQFPFRIELWIPKLGMNVVYNIFDFDKERPEISVFDVTDCFDDSESLRFRVRFPGLYLRDMEHGVKVYGQNALASTMQVSPLRVTELQVENDYSYLYLTATLLGRTPSLIQFTHLPKVVPERTDDFAWSNTSSDAECSDLCVNNADITCLSFLYCPSDRGSCRISPRHVSVGDPTLVSGTCDLYSRTVNVLGAPELTVKQAYDKLLDSIRTQTLSFDVPADDSMGGDYLAVDTEILFGQVNGATLPQLTGQFSYRVEIVHPRQNLVNTYDVWYDSASKLVRLDMRDQKAGPPFYTPFTVSSIHDFNTGVAYNIDTYRGNCTVTPLPSQNSFDVRSANMTQVLATGSEILSMKTPYQLFYLDNTYSFTGQKTVRGILCDVFESRRTDFHFGSGQQHSIFQFFFQSVTWGYEADTHDDVTMQQPVQLLIMDAEANELIIYNFYDFNDEHSSYGIFNIAPCFSDDHRIEFVLDFNQTYHPYLDSNEWQFRQEAQLLIASESQVSPTRVQNLQVTYNLDSTYVIATLLDQVSAIAHFAEAGTTHPYKAYIQTMRTEVGPCADDCFYSTDIICNSFDLCPDGRCYLSTMHVPDANVTSYSDICRHFSRVINGSKPEPALDDAFTALKDAVYKGFLNVKVPTSGTSQINFLATGVRSDVLHQNPPSETGGMDLHSKFLLQWTGKQLDDNQESLTGLAVDECATACISEEDFVCDAFSYCYATGDCYINANRPVPGQNLTQNPLCDVYTRLYLDNYHQLPGQAMETRADSTIKTRSAEECAHQCSVSTAFTCRSFDLCPSTGDCLLHHVHDLDTESSVHNSSFCSHYSRSYLADFTLQSNKIIPGNDDAVIEAVSPQQCAFECARQDHCHSFEFCQETCRLSSVLPSTTILADSSTCDLYSLTAQAVAPTRRPSVPPPSTHTRPHVPTGNQSPVTHAVRSSPSPASRPTSTAAQTAASTRRLSVPSPATHTGHQPPVTHVVRSSPPPASRSTSGAGCEQGQSGRGSSDTGPRVGIAFGVLVLGALLGAGLMFLFQRIRASRQDDAAMELVSR